MNILVINTGSSSLKYQLFDMSDESTKARGKVERIGLDTAIVTHEPTGNEEFRDVMEILDHTAAMREVLANLVHPERGVIASMSEVHAVGHRIVHGGETFSATVRVTRDVKKEIKRLYDLAPLHNPSHMMGIQAVEAILPDVAQAVCFDTAYHHTMPAKSYLYPIPMVLYRKHRIRRYGFHGTSHAYVSGRAADLINRPLDQLKMVTCHIGNGASVAAIMDGKSYDTSMGMTPLEGLMMGTRSGDIDPAIVPYAMEKEELTLREVNSMLNKHSGLYAISGMSSDMREIIRAMEEGNGNARLAFDMYEYRLRKYIGSYAAAMNGMDALVFTAGVGENSPVLRQAVCSQLTFMGVKLDEAANAIRSSADRLISTKDSAVAVMVIPTNEELMIARDTFRVINGG